MLIEFRAENYRSIRDEQALSLEAALPGGPGDGRTRTVADRQLLPAVALYGANASGKSNVLAAFAFMRFAVVDSHTTWAPDGGVPRDPFAWGPRRDQPSLWETALLVDGVRYDYGFVANDARFIEEWLYAWPLGRKQVWFEREGDVFKYGEHLRGENRLIEQVTRPNALFLSAAAQNRHEQLMPLFLWFRSTVFSGHTLLPHEARREPAAAWVSRLVRDVQQPQLFPELSGQDRHAGEKIEKLKGLLRMADIGIVDFKVESESLDVLSRGGLLPGRQQSRVLFRHQSAERDAWLPLESESNGTRTLFRIAPRIIDALRSGMRLLIDEMESSLHPLLAMRVIEMFNDPAQNPRHAQLVFTTHDTTLLGTIVGSPVLRRDQVWLTEKNQDGATELYPLTHYKPRKEENVERGYLQGRYGAIPFLGGLPPAGEPGDGGGPAGE